MTADATDNRLASLLQEAWLHHRDGDLAQARKRYRRALALDPQHPDANNLMGLLLIQSGLPGDAITFIERAVDAEAGNFQSWFNLGVAHQDLGRLVPARACFERTVELKPDHFEALNNLGHLHRLQGRFNAAGEALNKALTLQPGHPGVMLNIGLLENARHRFQHAEQAFLAVLQAHPENAEAHNGLGVALMGQSREEEADALFRKAAELRPDYADAHHNIGLVHLQQGQRDRAMQCFERAVTLEPANARALFSLGRMHEQLGRSADAESSFRRAIAAEPGLVEARYQLAQLSRAPASEQEIGELRGLLEGAPPRTSMRAAAAFALGLSLDSRGEHGRAFDAFDEAHQILRGAAPFDYDKTRRLHERIRETFSKSFVRSFHRTGTPDERPVFIVGMPRSGTTLAEQILASHPLIHGAGELAGMARVVRRLVQDSGGKYPALVTDVTGAQWKAQAERYLAELGDGAGAALRIVDNTPMNFIHAGLAASLLPDARFVFCLRDPLDNCVSIWRHALSAAHNYAHDLQDLGRYYRLHLDLLEHWREALGQRLFEWRYESLVDDPESQIRRLLDFIGLPPNPACLRFHETERFVQSPAAADVRRPLYSSSVGSWRRYETRLRPLLEALGEMPAEVGASGPAP